MDDGDGTKIGRRGRPWGPLARLVLRGLAILVIAVAASKLLSLSMDLTERLPDAGQGPMQTAILLTALLVYAVLIATPFVPGIEIALALLLVRGASIAPAVYLATLAGLLLAYFIGRLVPEATIARTFRDLRLTRAADLLARGTGLTPQARLEAVQNRLPRWLRAPLTRYRYVTLGLLMNLPGNAFIGGSGGLMLAAGLSRMFTPRHTILTLAIAILPLPVTVWWFGTAMITPSSF